jgi:hypothetical protein
MAIYSIRDLGRREILVMSAVLAGSGMVFSPKRDRPLPVARTRAGSATSSARLRGAGAKPEVFELREDCRPAADSPLPGRYLEPSLFALMER